MNLRFALLLAAPALPACGRLDHAPIAFVTNGVDPFWTIAAAGVAAGEVEFGIECDVREPNGIAEQQRIVEDLMTRGVKGIAISPIDAENEALLINEACARAKVITHDSDAPGTLRQCFIGVDNYAAGRMAGQLVKEALPDGGSVVIFIGRLEQDNSKKRRQGVIDELLGREFQGAYDPPDARLEGGGFTILDTRTDQFDYDKAKSNAEDAIALYPDLDCMVGLFAYNAPNCLEAIKAAGKLGEIKLVSFDEQDATLQGIRDGHVYGTVSQNPFEYGYHSVRILSALVAGDDSVLPEGGVHEVEPTFVRRENVDVFWSELKSRTDRGRAKESSAGG